MIDSRAALLVAAALVLGAAPANARTPSQTAAPAPRPSLLQVLSAKDRDLYAQAMTAANRGDWTAARGLADQGHDPIARRLITWRYLLDEDGGASFAEIDSFRRDHADWPLQHVLLARAEQAIPDTMAPDAVIAWFGSRKPETGIGQVRLGEALIASGQREKGKDLIRAAWIHDSFEPTEELAVIQRHGDLLTPAVDRERLDHLLWRGDIDAARREISRVDAQTRRLGEVRMALATHPRTGKRMLADLPQTLKADPGLIFDQARSLRRSGDDDEVPDLLVKAPIREMAKIDPGDWWGMLAMAARQAIKDRNYRIAYQLVSNTGLDDGRAFAEAEFMAGWLALRFLHQPKQALVHFQRLAEGVSRPISLARAYYWMGRAHEADNETQTAAHDFQRAAENPETFYGQLALTKLESVPRLRLKNTPTDIARVRAQYENDDLTHAIRILADLGEERFVRLFAVHDVERHQNAGYLELLASDLVRMGYRNVALRAAKTASYDGIDLLPYSHPVIVLPRYRGPGTAPEHALVLGLIRQETEFNADAVSRVGALGIMQLMPRTARRMARLARLPYHHTRLASDAHYNIELGMTELSSDLADWGGSYVLAAAAYNAGASNVKQWIADYGDPRAPDVDPIDWIELIPYSETRNYVQRVIENTEVYRSRLAGPHAHLQILADLYRPNLPPYRTILSAKSAVIPAADAPTPQMRPQTASNMATPAEAIALDETPDRAKLAVPQPLARPPVNTEAIQAVRPKEKPAR